MRSPYTNAVYLRFCMNEDASLVLGRQLVVSLLANAFLCTFPDHSPTHRPQPQEVEGDEGEAKMCPFTFSGLFSRLQKPTEKTMYVKCVCVSQYVCKWRL